MAQNVTQIFNQYLYRATTELLKQKIQLFNAASRGAIILRAGANQGDYSQEAFFGKIPGLVRRRNAFGSGAVTQKNIDQLLDVAVKVAAGTPPVCLDKGTYDWIQMDPKVAAAALAQQLAVDMMADMLNTGLLALHAAMSQTSAIVYDGTAGALTMNKFNAGARLFGDHHEDIKVWVSHSTPLFDLYDANLTNANTLFVYGTVRVMADMFGRLFIMTDSDSLINTTPVPDQYHILGLTSGAIIIEQNNDFRSNLQTTNGDENLLTTFQSQWTYNVGIKGYKWDITNGGHSPTDAALGTATNWDANVTSVKDGPGVIVDVIAAS